MYKILDVYSLKYWKGGFKGFSEHGKTWSSKRFLKTAIINRWLYDSTGDLWEDVKERIYKGLFVENIVTGEKIHLVDFIEQEILGKGTYFVCSECGVLSQYPKKVNGKLFCWQCYNRINK